MPLYGADLGVSGLSDVGVTEIQDDKTTVVARVQDATITELGSTGIYYRNWSLNSATAMLLWDSAADTATIRAVGAATERDIDQVTTAVGTDGTNLTEAGGTGDQLTALATAASIAALNDISAADVNAQVVDVLKTDTMTQSTLCPQEAPPVNATIEEAIAYLYKAWRNKSTQTATTYSLFADDTTTVDHKATVSDDGTTATKGEVATGP